MGTFDEVGKITDMKVAHTMAVALIGWYLIMPPTPWPSVPADLFRIPPLSKWRQMHSFDRAEECQAFIAASEEGPEVKRSEERMREAWAAVIAQRKLPSKSPEAEAMWRAFDDFQKKTAPICIASDDVRLK